MKPNNVIEVVTQIVKHLAHFFCVKKKPVSILYQMEQKKFSTDKMRLDECAPYDSM